MKYINPNTEVLEMFVPGSEQYIAEKKRLDALEPKGIEINELNELHHENIVHILVEDEKTKEQYVKGLWVIIHQDEQRTVFIHTPTGIVYQMDSQYTEHVYDYFHFYEHTGYSKEVKDIVFQDITTTNKIKMTPKEIKKKLPNGNFRKETMNLPIPKTSGVLIDAFIDSHTRQFDIVTGAVPTTSYRSVGTVNSVLQIDDLVAFYLRSEYVRVKSSCEYNDDLFISFYISHDGRSHGLHNVLIATDTGKKCVPLNDGCTYCAPPIYKVGHLTPRKDTVNHLIINRFPDVDLIHAIVAANSYDTVFYINKYDGRNHIETKRVMELAKLYGLRLREVSITPTTPVDTFVSNRTFNDVYQHDETVVLYDGSFLLLPPNHSLLNLIKNTALPTSDYAKYSGITPPHSFETNINYFGVFEENANTITFKKDNGKTNELPSKMKYFADYQDALVYANELYEEVKNRKHNSDVRNTTPQIIGFLYDGFVNDNTLPAHIKYKSEHIMMNNNSELDVKRHTTHWVRM